MTTSSKHQPPKKKKSKGATPSKVNKDKKQPKQKGLTRTAGRANDNSARNPVSKTLILVWILVSGELLLDLVTTIISFIALLNDFECCGEAIELGRLSLGITIPFFLLILIELCLLVLTIKKSLTMTQEEATREAANAKDDDRSWCRVLGQTFNQKLINGLLLLNPFFGFMVAWMLLYQSNKKESMAVLGLEAGSLVLHWLSIYLEGQKQTWFSLAIHSIPIIPFTVTVIVILIYVNQGGVCYLVEDEMFWYKGCYLCSDGYPPPEDGMCTDGTEGEVGTYCSADTNFCFIYY
jgi:hypothetical protein